MKSFLFICVITASLTGCITNKKITKNMNSWLGSTKQNLVMQLGPPTKTESDGASGQILVYANRVYYVQNNIPVDYWVYKMFFINTSNIVYHWIFKKNPNPPERVDIRFLAN